MMCYSYPQPMMNQGYYLCYYPVYPMFTPPAVQELPIVPTEIIQTPLNDISTNEDTNSSMEEPKKGLEDKSETRAQLNVKNRDNSVQYLKGSTNIQKNFAKAIAAYCHRNQEIVQKLLKPQQVREFVNLLCKIKKSIRNINQFANYTMNPDFIRTFRIMSSMFMKKHAITYIYNSKLQQKTSHIKSRRRIHKNLIF